MRQIRNLKLLGAFALATLAVNVSAANAAEGTAVVFPGTNSYTALQTGSGHTLALVGGRVLSCSTATLSGSINNGDKSITATPSYSGCSVKVGLSTLPATVNMDGCTYKFTDLTTTASNTYRADTAINCPAVLTLPSLTWDVHHITIKVYQSAKLHESGTRLCEYTIGSKEWLTGAHFTDNSNGTLNITATNVAIPTNRVFGTVGNCGEAAFNSTYNGDTLATAASGVMALDD